MCQSRVPALVAEFGNNVNLLVIKCLMTQNQNGAKDENDGGLRADVHSTRTPMASRLELPNQRMFASQSLKG